MKASFVTLIIAALISSSKVKLHLKKPIFLWNSVFGSQSSIPKAIGPCLYLDHNLELVWSLTTLNEAYLFNLTVFFDPEFACLKLKKLRFFSLFMTMPDPAGYQPMISYRIIAKLWTVIYFHYLCINIRFPGTFTKFYTSLWERYVASTFCYYNYE